MSKTPKIRVYVEKKSIYKADLVKKTLVEFAKKVGKSVKFSKPIRESHVAEYKANKYELCIYLFCVPEYLCILYVNNLYDYCDNVHKMMLFSVPRILSYESGRIVDYNGNEVALIVGKTLYILCQIQRYSEGLRIDLLEHILNDYSLFLQDKAQFDLEMKKRLDGKSQELFCNTINANSREIGMSEAANLLSSIRSNMSSLAKAELRRQILTMKVSEENLRVRETELFGLYERLCLISSNGKISSISNRYDTEIIIPVGQIDIKYRDKVYDIGEFVVKIDLRHFTIECQNLTRDIQSYNHPCVRRYSQDINMGNASCGVAQLLGQLMLDIVVKMIVGKLRSYDPADNLLEIENWPEKQD